MPEPVVHAAALAMFFAVALCRECSHVPLHEWSWNLLRHTAHQSIGETLYLFAIHLLVYSGYILPHN